MLAGSLYVAVSFAGCPLVEILDVPIAPIAVHYEWEFHASVTFFTPSGSLWQVR
jgi:hypothetical protein